MGEPIQVTPVRADPRKRAMKIAGVAILLLLALKVLPGVLFGGEGSDPEDDAFATVNPPGLVTPVAPVEGAPETALTFSSKNPFEPLASIDEGAGAPTVTTDTIPEIAPPIVLDPLVPDDGDGDLGGTTGPTAGPTTGETGATPTPSPAPPARQPDRVAMLEIFTGPDGSPQARIRINDTVHEVREGADFAVSYRLLDVNSTTRCAQLLFGDDRFQLCEGEETLK